MTEPLTRTLERPLAPHWHRPLIVLAGAMAVLTAISLVGLFVDPRQITGAPLWAKPLKFALSIGLYAVTLSWLLGLLPRARRLGWWAGTVVAVFLVIEMVIIVGAAVSDTTSHFNVSTPFATVLWAVMAASISIVWVATAVVGVLLFRAPLGDPARSFAIRAAVIVALIGMGLAFLMTGPQPDQLADYRGIVGAHTVGLADGGPGIPILGWSTVGGDLRIPHFVGMHALQIIPLVAIALERVVVNALVRRRILVVVTALYLALVAVLTGQALGGESIVKPGATVVTITVALVAASVIATAVIVRRVGSPRPSAGIPR